MPKLLAYYRFIFIAVLAASLAGCGGNGGRTMVGLLFPDLENERWKKEEAMLTRLLEEKGYEVISETANQDERLQSDQVDNLIREGAKAILIVAVDGDTIIPAVDAAIAADIKVLAYDRLIKSPKISAYVSFDNREAGRLQARGLLDALDVDNHTGNLRLVRLGGAETDHNSVLYRLGQDEVLAPYLAARKVRIVADETIATREQVSAQRLMETVLEDERNNIDAVLVSNEVLGLGILDAIKAAELEDAILVAGQETSQISANSIAKGELALSIYRDTRDLPHLAVSLLDRLLNEKPLLELQHCLLSDLTGDETQEGTISCILLPVHSLTQDNLFELVVRSGYESYDDVYREIPDGLRPARP